MPEKGVLSFCRVYICSSQIVSHFNLLISDSMGMSLSLLDDSLGCGDGGGRTSTLKDLIEDNLTYSGSGSGLPLLIQRSVAQQIQLSNQVCLLFHGKPYL